MMRADIRICEMSKLLLRLAILHVSLQVVMIHTSDQVQSKLSTGNEQCADLFVCDHTVSQTTEDLRGLEENLGTLRQAADGCPCNVTHCMLNKETYSGVPVLVYIINHHEKTKTLEELGRGFLLNVQGRCRDIIVVVVTDDSKQIQLVFDEDVVYTDVCRAYIQRTAARALRTRSLIGGLDQTVNVMREVLQNQSVCMTIEPGVPVQPNFVAPLVIIIVAILIATVVAVLLKLARSRQKRTAKQHENSKESELLTEFRPELPLDDTLQAAAQV